MTAAILHAVDTRFGAPVAGDEKAVLSGFLDHYRGLLLQICDGLAEEQLRRSMVPSGTSLLGLVKHLAFVERGWFQETVANQKYEYPFDLNNPDADFRIEEYESAEDVFNLYRDACDRSRQALEDASLDDLVEHPRRRADYNVRWVVAHMLEETARHVGHADILREQLDGTTGTGYDR